MCLRIRSYLTASLLLVGCNRDRLWVASNLVPEVQIISDSADVRLLVSLQERNDAAELRWLEGLEPRGEREPNSEQADAQVLERVLDNMAAKPGFSVRGGTSCRLLETSQARCSRYRRATRTYVKVQIVDGPKRGQEGWACGGIDVFSTTPGFP
jgi:hypothetical protein